MTSQEDSKNSKQINTGVANMEFEMSDHSGLWNAEEQSNLEFSEHN